jgi:hypothetical protein
VKTEFSKILLTAAPSSRKLYFRVKKSPRSESSTGNVAMLQERIEGKWLAAFRRVFALNGIGKGTRIAILSETQSRPVLVQLSELAAYDLGAEFCMIQMPTPPQTAPVPVKSTGTSWAIQGNRAVIEALKLVEVIVDCTVEGLIHAPEWPEIEDAGGTRLLVITNEHPEILERTEPKAEDDIKLQIGIQMLREASEMRVTSAAGTDLTVDLRGAPCGGTAGFGTKPGAVAHWPAGLCLAFPGKDAVNGRIVMDVGDMNLTFKTFLTSRIDFHRRERLRHRDQGRRHRRAAPARVHGGLGRPQRLWPVPRRLGHEPRREMDQRRDVRQARHAGRGIPRHRRVLPVVHRRQPVCRPLHAGPFRPSDEELHHRPGWARRRA